MDKSVIERLMKIKSLQEKISSCKDDRLAIHYQEQLVDILKDTFKDKELLETIVRSNLAKKQNK